MWQGETWYMPPSRRLFRDIVLLDTLIRRVDCIPPHAHWVIFVGVMSEVVNLCNYDVICRLPEWDDDDDDDDDQEEAMMIMMMVVKDVDDEMKWNDWVFRPRFCTVRLCWAEDNLGEWDDFFYMNHANRARSIAGPVGQQSIAPPLYHGWIHCRWW